MIKEKKYVPTVNINVLNPKLKLEENDFVVQQTTEPWITQEGKPRIAALNSFGFGGSNVHVILREVPSKQCLHEASVNRPNNVLTLSARSREALQKMARLYSNWINDNIEDMDESFVVNLCYSLNELHGMHGCPSFPQYILVNNGNRTEWRLIRAVIIRVINKIGRSRSRRPIISIRSMVNGEIGRHEVLLPINQYYNKIC